MLRRGKQGQGQSQRCDDEAEDGLMGLLAFEIEKGAAVECRWLLEARKGKETDSFIESPGRDRSPLKTILDFQNCNTIHFCCLRC